MAINSRNKGNRNERNAAKLVSEWTGRKFERTPSSGGLQWKASFSKGDIVCTVEGHVFPFCVEVKAHREINFSHLLLPGVKNVKIFDFWYQATRDAEKCLKIPMLLMRYDGMPKEFFFLGIPNDFYKALFPKMGLALMDAPTLSFWDKKKHSITFIRSTDFFKLPYTDVKKLAKEYLKIRR